MSTRVPRAADLGLDLGEILQRVAAECGVSTDAKLARELGVGRSSISTWRTADTLPFEVLFGFANARKLSMDWLLTGEGCKHLDAQASANEQLRIRDAVLGDTYARAARSAKAKARSALKEAELELVLKADRAEINLDRMRHCIELLATVASSLGKVVPPPKFAQACVLVYQLALQSQSLPDRKAVEMLLETIS